MKNWTPEQFKKLQRIARRHAIRCPLRMILVTGEDPDGTRNCNCNGKLNRWGESKNPPREKNLADVMAQLGIQGCMP